MINKPFYQYRHPEDLETKYVYDFSNSIDLEKELEKRRLRLMGFRRSTLDEQNDFKSMTFCGDIDEVGTHVIPNVFFTNKNEFMSPPPGITNLNSSTEDSLGLTKKTTISFV